MEPNIGLTRYFKEGHESQPSSRRVGWLTYLPFRVFGLQESEIGLPFIANDFATSEAPDRNDHCPIEQWNDPKIKNTVWELTFFPQRRVSFLSCLAATLIRQWKTTTTQINNRKKKQTMPNQREKPNPLKGRNPWLPAGPSKSTDLSLRGDSIFQ